MKITKEDIEIVHLDYDVEEIKKASIDSMLCDSGTTLVTLTYKIPKCSNEEEMAVIDIRGEVRVAYNGRNYYRASEFPKELVEIFRNPENWGEYFDRYNITIWENNWCESLLTKNGDFVGDFGDICDGLFDETEESIKAYLIDIILQFWNYEMKAISD